MVGIKTIEYYLPEKAVANEDLQLLHPDWDMEKVASKSGVYARHIASTGETALDLAIKAVQKIFDAGSISKEAIQGIMFCTQSPDFIMPSNAFLIHKHFGFSHNVWAFDYNLACSGFIYGVTIARGMIETGMGKNILLITADTYSRYINPEDRSTSVLFGDGAAATIVAEMEMGIIDVSLASAGSEYESFYIPAGGCRLPKNETTGQPRTNHSGNQTSAEEINMNGFGVWKFISRTVPIQIKELLQRNNLAIEDIQFFGFHQASKMTLDSLFKALGVPPEKWYMNMQNIGNTVSASIPIALHQATLSGKLKKGDLVVLSGFGVGLSWGSLLMRY